MEKNLKRFTLKADEFKSYEPFTFDEYFGLIIPKENSELSIPAAHGVNIRAEPADIPEDQRPDLRWCSVRRHAKKKGEVVFDAIIHGDSGPATRWAQNVTVGDQVGFRTLGGAYEKFTGTQLLVADATEIPALMAILDHLTDSQLQSTSVVAIAEDAEHYDPTLHDFQSQVHSVTILEASLDEQAERVMELLRSEYQREYDYAWLCGESTLAKSTRAVVVKEWGITKTNVLFSGYWKLGKYVG